MFPRYGRKNRKYKMKLSPKKMSFEQKIKWQVLASAVLLALGIGMSFLKLTPKNRINTYLYHTYSSNEWKRALSPAVKNIGKYSKKAVSVYLSLFSNESKQKMKTVSDIPEVRAENVRKKKKVNAPKTVSNVVEAKEATVEEWKWPHPGNISSPFGERIHPINGQKSSHRGIDIAAPYGDSVTAVHSGMVERTGYDNSNGNYVVLSHGNEITSVYIHLSEILVNKGDAVPSGGVVGKVGATGLATGPHIHFEIKVKGESVDPQKFITVK